MHFKINAVIPASVFMASSLRRNHFIFDGNEQLQHPQLQASLNLKSFTGILLICF